MPASKDQLNTSGDLTQKEVCVGVCGGGGRMKGKKSIRAEAIAQW